MLKRVKRNPFFAFLGDIGVIFTFGFWSLMLVIRRAIFLARKYEDLFIKKCADWNMFCLGLTAIVENQELYDPGERAIVISNHSSFVDIPVIFTACSSRLRCIGKEELFWIPILGWGMKAARHVPVKRDKKDSASKARELLASRLDEGYQIWIAPEGKRSATGCLLPFKTGAFRIAHEQKAPIYVLGLYNLTEILPKPKLLPLFKGEVLAKFLGKIEPVSDLDQVKSAEELLKEARALFLQNGFHEC